MKRFKHILYVIGDENVSSSPSLLRAISLAKNNQANLILLRVLPRIPSFLSRTTSISEQELETQLLERERTGLQHLLSLLEVGLGATGEVRMGKKYIEIIRLVQEAKVDLVIKQADDVEWLDRFMGSDDMHLLRKCPCPVWLMQANEKADYQHIMAAVDLGDDNEAGNAELNEMILDLGSSLSLSDFATLHVVNAYDVPDAGFVSLWAEQPEKAERDLLEAELLQRQYRMNALLDALKHRIGEKSYNYLAPRAHLVQGIPSRELPALAEAIHADLIVMGTVARTGIAGVIIGNTAENVLSQLHCSVLAIKPSGFVSPIK